MSLLFVAYELARFAVIAAWCRFHGIVESRITRCTGRCDANPPEGVIGQGWCRLCSVADFLWSLLPCGQWQPIPNIVPKERPCDCDEEGA